MTITGNEEFNGIYLEIIWKLLETCIQSIMTYGGETWNTTKKEMQEINRSLDKIIKRILMTPPSTPREALYIETGLLDNEYTISRNRINMQTRLNRTQNKLIKSARESGNKGGWEEETEETKTKMKIRKKDYKGNDLPKTIIKKRVNTAFKKNLVQTGKEKSKVMYLTQGRKKWKICQRQEYMSKLTRYQASIIFRARTRMLKFKDNFRAMYKDNTCRLCNKEKETQEHVMDCISNKENIKISKEEIFCNSTAVLKNTARKLKIMMEVLENS